MDGTWGVGLPHYTQAIERHHQKVDKVILEALREENPAARLPAVTDVIRAIFYKCLRLWSTNAAPFEHFVESNLADYRQTKHVKGETLLLEISEGVYCFTRKNSSRTTSSNDKGRSERCD